MGRRVRERERGGVMGFDPKIREKSFLIYNSRRLRDIQRGFEMNLLQFEMDSKGIEKNSRRGGKGFFSNYLLGKR